MYCRLPDGIKGVDSFGIDHYKPQKIFPALATTYTNLFYCCNCCNARKGSFWPTAEQLRDQEFIPNPCDHVMFDHLQYKHAVVAVKSAAGKQADRILDLNDEQSTKYRELVLDIIKAFENDARECSESIAGLEQKIEQIPQRKAEFEMEKAAAEAELARIRANLTRICG